MLNAISSVTNVLPAAGAPKQTAKLCCSNSPSMIHCGLRNSKSPSGTNNGFGFLMLPSCFLTLCAPSCTITSFQSAPLRRGAFHISPVAIAAFMPGSSLSAATMNIVSGNFSCIAFATLGKFPLSSAKMQHLPIDCATDALVAQPSAI